MTETPWQLLGRLARARREFLGIGQGDLAAYGGPGVSTVGKIERAAQDNYPTRTQHQLENALGWKRGAVREILAAPSDTWWHDEALRGDFERSLIEDNVPDLSSPAGATDVRRAADLTDEELLAELTYRMRALRYAAERSDDEYSTSTNPAGGSPAPGSNLTSLTPKANRTMDLTWSRAEHGLAVELESPPPELLDAAARQVSEKGTPDDRVSD